MRAEPTDGIAKWWPVRRLRPSVRHVLKRWTAWLQDHRRAVSLAAAAIIGGLVIAWALIVPIADWLATHGHRPGPQDRASPAAADRPGTPRTAGC